MALRRTSTSGGISGSEMVHFSIFRVVEDKMCLFSPSLSASHGESKQIYSVICKDSRARRRFMYPESVCNHAWSDARGTVASPSAERGSGWKDDNKSYMVMTPTLL